MATQLFLRLTTSDWSAGSNEAKLDGAAGSWQVKQLLTTRGAGANNSATTASTVTGPTSGIEVGGSGTQVVFISAPLDADITISGSITWNIWAYESNMAANVAINGILEVIDGATGAYTLIDQTTRTTELGTATAVNNFAETPAAGVACKRGDRLRVRIFGDDAGTMAATYTFRISVDGTTAGADGDTYLTLTENLTFVSEPAGTQIFLTDTASAVSTAAVDREAWTARGAGVVTDVRNTAAGWTAPLQITDTAGGTVVDWWTRPLTAFTLGGAVRCNIRMLHSGANQAAPRVEIAIVANDGSGAVDWGRTSHPGPMATTEAAYSFLVSGDDVAITAGQRLRIRVFIDDRDSFAMTSGGTTTLYYAGTLGGVSGNTYLTFSQTLTESANGTNAPAENASGTGTASNASTHVKPTAGNASGTGAANNAAPVSGINAPAQVASGTGSAHNATVMVSTSAGIASGLGAASNGAASIKPTAGNAAGTGSAANTSSSVSPTAQAASGTGTASGATTKVSPTAGSAAGTGTANNATAPVNQLVQATVASGTGTASNAATKVNPTAGSAAGTGSAGNAASSIAPTAQDATGTGSAANATVSTASFISANATAATGTGNAANASTSIELTSLTANGTGAANNSSSAITVNAGSATGTGSASNAVVSIEVAAGSAIGTGTAYNATVDTASATNAAAGLASGTGAAYNAIIPVPVWTTPADTVTMGATPTLQFTLPAITAPTHAWIELDLSAAFNTGDLRVIRSDLDQTGWDFWNGTGWEAVGATGIAATYSGNEVRHTVQTALSGGTWHRRVRVGS